jgi:inosose dehydratase
MQAATSSSPIRSRAARDIPQETVGFCLDTGHTFCAGTDPTETLANYADRLDYIHFTDIDCAKFDEVMGRCIRFFEPCGEGVVCPIAGAASTTRRSASY